MQARRQTFRRMFYREGKERSRKREGDKVAEGEREVEEPESQQRKGLWALR